MQSCFFFSREVFRKLDTVVMLKKEWLLLLLCWKCPLDGDSCGAFSWVPPNKNNICILAHMAYIITIWRLLLTLRLSQRMVPLRVDEFPFSLLLQEGVLQQDR